MKHAKTLTSTHKKSTAANHVAGSRSRSASVMPAGSADPEPERKSEEKDEEEKEEAVDDKLYCVCKTKYDEDRFMIACDRLEFYAYHQAIGLTYCFQLRRVVPYNMCGHAGS